MSEELKPVRCGCGGEAKFGTDINQYTGNQKYWIQCEKCGTQTKKHKTKEEAIEAWDKAMGAKDINVPAKWIPYPDCGYWVCSECGFVSEAFSANILYHYCPKCGSLMNG